MERDSCGSLALDRRTKIMFHTDLTTQLASRSVDYAGLIFLENPSILCSRMPGGNEASENENLETSWMK